MTDEQLAAIKAEAEAALKRAPEYGATYDFMVDVWPRVLTELDRLRAAEAAIRTLAADCMTEGIDGQPTDASTLWPSEVLKALEGREADR